MAACVDAGARTEDASISHVEETFPRTPPPTYGVGSVLNGKYRLDALVGEGAMGAVWQATNLVLDAPVAIKLTHADLDREFRDRLQFEARAAAGISHPAIVRVFDVSETEHGEPFIVMELLQGSTLGQLLKRGRLTALRAVQILLPIIDALGTMHARGIVHRDVKPDNLLVSFENEIVQPKLLDFGIAKRDDPRLGEPQFDESGKLVGSPEYMSPEQAEARDDVDRATDIWSICVVLYEAVVGEPPFNAHTPEALFYSILMEEPTSLVELGVADEQLWEIVRVGLAKERGARHESMSVLGRALGAWLVTNGVKQDVCGTSLETKWLDLHSAVGVTPRFGHDASPWLPDDRPTRPPAGALASSSAAVARPRRAPRLVAACALIGSLALAVYFTAQTRSSAARATAIEASVVDRSVARGSPGEPAAALGDGVGAEPATNLVNTTPVVRPAAHEVVRDADQKATATPSSSNGKHKEATAPAVVAAPRPAAKANGTDLGLLAPY